MVDTNMVFTDTQNVCQEPTPSSRKSGPSSGTIRKSPLYDSTKLPKTSDLDNLRESLQAEEISKRATILTTKCPKTSSFNNYESAWCKWVSWYSGRKICPTGCDINNILGYEVELFDSALQCNTKWSYKSSNRHFMIKLVV